MPPFAPGSSCLSLSVYVHCHVRFFSSFCSVTVTSLIKSTLSLTIILPSTTTFPADASGHSSPLTATWPGQWIHLIPFNTLFQKSNPRVSQHGLFFAQHALRLSITVYVPGWNPSQVIAAITTSISILVLYFIVDETANFLPPSCHLVGDTTLITPVDSMLIEPFVYIIVLRFWVTMDEFLYHHLCPYGNPFTALSSV